MYFHAEADAVITPFEGTLSIRPASRSILPPGTGESFYQAGVKNTVVITGYDTVFTNSYLGSVFHESIDTEKVEKIAATVFEYVLSELDVKTEVTIESTYLDSLMHCLALDGNCTVIETTMGYRSASITSQLKNEPINKFAGTYNVRVGIRPNE